MIKLKQKYTKLATEIRKLLKAKKLYEPSDNTLITELVYWHKLGDDAKVHIETEGIVVNVVRDESKQPLYQTNQAVSVLKESSSKIAMLYTKLSISPQERSKLKIVDEENNSSFDDDFIND